MDEVFALRLVGMCEAVISGIVNRSRPAFMGGIMKRLLVMFGFGCAITVAAQEPNPFPAGLGGVMTLNQLETNPLPASAETRTLARQLQVDLEQLGPLLNRLSGTTPAPNSETPPVPPPFEVPPGSPAAYPPPLVGHNLGANYGQNLAQDLSQSVATPTPPPVGTPPLPNGPTGLPPASPNNNGNTAPPRPLSQADQIVLSTTESLMQDVQANIRELLPRLDATLNGAPAAPPLAAIPAYPPASPKSVLAPPYIQPPGTLPAASPP